MSLYESDFSYTTSGKLNGVVVGIVTNNEDPEYRGRVKVKFPIQELNYESDWIRIATLMSGKEKGTLFLPEVDDEVLVAFHLGDVRQPFVIGSLWNKDSGPPREKKKGNDIRKIKSRAGHEIIFDDKDKGKVTVQSKEQHKIEIDDGTDSITVKDGKGKSSIELKGGAGSQITIMSGSTKIFLNNKGEVTIKGNGSIGVEGTSLSLEAKGNLDIKGASINIKGTGMVNIKGSMIKMN